MAGPLARATRWAVNKFFYNPKSAQKKEVASIAAFEEGGEAAFNAPFNYTSYEDAFDTQKSQERKAKQLVRRRAETVKFIESEEGLALKAEFLENVKTPEGRESERSKLPGRTLEELRVLQGALQEIDKPELKGLSNEIASQEFVKKRVGQPAKPKAERLLGTDTPPSDSDGEKAPSSSDLDEGMVSLDEPTGKKTYKTSLTKKFLDDSAEKDYTRGEAYYLPAAEGMPTIVAFHGNDGLAKWQFLKLYEECKEKGYGLFCPEYRSYLPNRPVASSEESLYNDGRAAIKYLRQEKGISESNIIVYGESLGAAVATNVAYENSKATAIQKGSDPREPLKGLVLNCPFTSAREAADWVVEEESQKEGRGRLFRRAIGSVARTLINRHVPENEFNNAEKAKDITVPTWVISSSGDTKVNTQQHYIVNGFIEEEYWHEPKKVDGEHLESSLKDVFEVIGKAAGAKQVEGKEEEKEGGVPLSQSVVLTFSSQQDVNVGVTAEIVPSIIPPSKSGGNWKDAEAPGEEEIFTEEGSKITASNKAHALGDVTIGSFRVRVVQERDASKEQETTEPFKGGDISPENWRGILKETGRSKELWEKKTQPDTGSGKGSGSDRGGHK